MNSRGERRHQRRNCGALLSFILKETRGNVVSAAVSGIFAAYLLRYPLDHSGSGSSVVIATD